MNAKPLRAPFPYFGGKRRAAERIWAALGTPDHYVEPFCGSAAVLLARPDPARCETINDADGMVSNFWRAIRSAPDATAEWADWPVNEVDLHARHLWLIGQRESLTERLIADPEWCDPNSSAGGENANQRRERLWLSPACVGSRQRSIFDVIGGAR